MQPGDRTTQPHRAVPQRQETTALARMIAGEPISMPNPMDSQRRFAKRQGMGSPEAPLPIRSQLIDKWNAEAQMRRRP